MKLLVVSNLYPPHFVGGYELGCRDVVEGLKGRGHEVRVLAGDFRNAGPDAPPDGPEIERSLTYSTERQTGARFHFAECRKLRRAVKAFSPDLVYFWNIGGLNCWLPLAARWMGCRIAFFLSDTNFIAWRVGAWLGGLARRSSLVRQLFGRSVLVQGWSVIRDLSCHFASDFLRQTARSHGVPFAEATSLIVPWGIDPALFAPTEPRRARWPVKHLLYVGQMNPLKGIHTAVRALAGLARTGLDDLHLTIVGGGTHADYEARLRALAQELGVAARVEFRGRVARTELPGIYAESDLLVFPSEWAEPFAITPLEAMSCGLAVAGTTTGGSSELFRDGVTAMTFRAGDAADAARAIGALCRDRELFESVRTTGRRTVRDGYTLDHMISRIDAGLRALVDQPR